MKVRKEKKEYESMPQVMTALIAASATETTVDKGQKRG